MRVRGRHASAVVASLCFAIACGGAAFTADPDETTGGASGSSGASSTAGKAAKGGSSASAGSTSVAGRAGSSSQGGMVGVGGSIVSSGGNVQGDGGEVTSTTSCKVASDCDASSLCREATCLAGTCAEKDLPDGAYELQVPGDCQELRCQDGNETIAAAPTDSNDQNECTVDSCSADGKPVHTARYGELCSNGGGTCSHEGKCDLCNRQLCPPTTECNLQLCTNGQCTSAPRPKGSLCEQQTNQCDGNGSCVDCTDNGGCDEASACSFNKCIPA